MKLIPLLAFVPSVVLATALSAEDRTIKPASPNEIKAVHTATEWEEQQGFHLPERQPAN